VHLFNRLVVPADSLLFIVILIKIEQHIRISPMLHSQSPVKILLDTDPGGDDAYALLWLLSLMQQGIVDLVAIATAGGNVAAQQTFTNASQLLNLAGFPQIVVGRGQPHDGANQPAAAGEDASHIHGSDGMGGLSATLPPATHAYDTAPDSAQLILQTLRSAPGEVTILAIAPFTNLAAAERLHPGILQQAKQLVLMAGAFDCPGNVTPQAEFNVWFDPAAMQTVLASRTDTVVISLDVTRQLIFTRAMAQQLHQANSNSPRAQFLLDLCEFMISTALGYRETAGIPGFLVHDAATVAYLVYPELFTFQRVQVQVETAGQWCVGQTVRDRRSLSKPTANAWMSATVDAQRLFANLLQDLQCLM
jgi:inosine-uridine nucleoside N-ribohydrolase